MRHTDVELRCKELLQLIEAGIQRARFRSRANHWVSMFLMVIALFASGFAGIAGLTSTSLDKKVIGAIALVPASLALVSNTMKFDEKAKYHNRKKTALQAISRRLRFEAPDNSLAEIVALVSSSYSEIDTQYNEEWEREFSLSWSWTTARSKR